MLKTCPDVAMIRHCNHLTMAFLCVFVLACDSSTPEEETQEVANVSISSAAAERADFTIPVGQGGKLNGAATDDSGNVVSEAEIAWTSSDPAIASVDQEGVIEAIAPGTTTITAASGTSSAAVELKVFSLTGDWMSVPGSVTPGISMEMTQNGETVTGTFTNQAWTSVTSPDIGRGPISGTIEWNRFVHTADVAQGCVWQMSATIIVSVEAGAVVLTANEDDDPWQIQSDCGGGGTLSIPELRR